MKRDDWGSESQSQEVIFVRIRGMSYAEKGQKETETTIHIHRKI
jgi:hypothetical protein